jgi:hypothetical protein
VTTLEELRESQTKAITEMLLHAHSKHVAGLEAMILRYQRDLLDTVEASRHAITTAADNHVTLAVVLNNVIHDFDMLARHYVPKACDFGFARALTDLQSRGWLRHIHGTPHADDALSAPVLMQNIRYLHDSLLPAMHKAIFDSASPDAKLTAMKARIGSYAHWLWRSSEQAYITTLRDFANRVKVSKKV